MQNLTDAVLERSDWPVIFDQRTFVADRENEQFMHQQLYNKDIFGLVIDDDGDKVCKRCCMDATQCIGHFALLRLKESHRYILPTYLASFVKLAMTYDATLKRIKRSTGGNLQSRAIAVLRDVITPQDFSNRTSVYVIVLPLTARFQYMNESRFQIKKKCQYTQLLTMLMREERYTVMQFHQELENMNVQKNRSGGTWDLSQIRSFKRLNLRPSLHDTLSRKEGFVRKSCIGGRVNLTNRQVAIPNSQLEMDEVGVSPEIYDAIDSRNNVVISCRHPSLYCTNMMKVKLVPILASNSKVHAYPPEICEAYHLDFDGDETNLYYYNPRHADDETCDYLLHTPQNLLRHDYGYTLCTGSYNAICGAYMLTRWPDRVIRPEVVYELNHILLLREQTEFDYHTCVTRQRLFERLISILTKVDNLSLADYMRNGRLLSNAVWRKEQWSQIEEIAKWLRRGDERQYLRDFRTVTQIINRFLYFHSAEITVSCGAFVEAHRRAQMAVTTMDRRGELFERYDDLAALALEWFPATTGEHIIVDSQCKGTRYHLVQGVACIGPVSVNYFINDFSRLCRLLNISTKRVSKSLAIAFVRGNYFDGLCDTERYVVSISGREGPVISIVNTPDGGYGRRKAAFLTSGYIINYLGSIQEGREGHRTRWLPPPLNVLSLDRYLDIRLGALAGVPLERRFSTTTDDDVRFAPVRIVCATNDGNDEEPPPPRVLPLERNGRWNSADATTTLVRDAIGRFLVFD